MSPTRICPGPTPGQPCPTRARVHATPGSKTATRCPTCKAAWQQAKDQRRPQRRSYAEQQHNAAVVTDHVNTHGWWCPGIPGEVEPHSSRDLTADHIPAVAITGNEHGPRIARCRSCNSKLGAKLATR